MSLHIGRVFLAVFYFQEAALNALLVVKDCLDDAVLKTNVLPCTKGQFLQTVDVKANTLIY